MKRRLFAGAVIVMCLSLLGFGTLAYFTAEDTAHNVITSGDINIELQEWADEEKTTPFPEDLYPCGSGKENRAGGRGAGRT